MPLQPDGPRAGSVRRARRDGCAGARARACCAGPGRAGCLRPRSFNTHAADRSGAADGCWPRFCCCLGSVVARGSVVAPGSVVGRGSVVSRSRRSELPDPLGSSSLSRVGSTARPCRRLGGFWPQPLPCASCLASSPSFPCPSTPIPIHTRSQAARRLLPAAGSPPAGPCRGRPCRRERSSAVGDSSRHPAAHLSSPVPPPPMPPTSMRRCRASCTARLPAVTWPG